jgi:hypothetical protein
VAMCGTDGRSLSCSVHKSPLDCDFPPTFLPGGHKISPTVSESQDPHVVRPILSLQQREKCLEGSQGAGQELLESCLLTQLGSPAAGGRSTFEALLGDSSPGFSSGLAGADILCTACPTNQTHRSNTRVRCQAHGLYNSWAS